MLFKKKKYYFNCEDIGMNCGYSIKGASSEDEILDILKVHAKYSHNIDEIPNDLVAKIKSNIKKM
jgi:predicted small metal-binding protein